MKSINELRAYNMKFININKIVMTIIKHDRVVSRLPLIVEQNINVKAPLKFKWRLDVKISKEKHHSYTADNRILGQAHYTKNDSYALEEVLKERMTTQH